MGILGAPAGDLTRCLAGDEEACERVAFGYFIWPRLQQMLEKLKLAELPPVIFPIPRPDPPPYEEIGAAVIAPMFLRQQPTKERHATTERVAQRFAEGLRELADELESEFGKGR